uniref:Uncharacterized protein n=1 Tax=Alexandrium monilatum TaxID=311494 RepID=A0A7S4QFF6_9DINO
MPNLAGTSRSVKRIVQPEAVDDGQSDHLVLDTSRMELADGLPLVNLDPHVSPARRNRIKVVRSAVLALVSGLLHAGLSALVSSLSVSERRERYPGSLVLDVCLNGSIHEVRSLRTQTPVPTTQAGGPPLWAPPWVHVLGLRSAKKAIFKAVDRDGLERLPRLVYFSSEDNRGMIESNAYMALSFGLLRVLPLEFVVTLQSTRCLPDLHRTGRPAPPGTGAANAFAQAVLGSLATAQRRRPREGNEEPWFGHGALLLQKRAQAADAAWDPLAGGFRSYAPSRGVSASLALFAAVTLGATAGSAVALAARAHAAWSRAVAEWTVQYDYLWLLARRPTEASLTPRPKHPGSARSAGAQGRAVPSMPARGEVEFTDAIQLCSPFFIMDNVVGDARSNEEQWDLAILSAMVHGLTLAVFAVLPAATAVFIGFLKVPFHALSALNFLSGVLFGTLYYCSVPFARPPRRLALCASLAVLAHSALWGLLYLNAVVVFLLTRLVATPREVVALAVPAGTVYAHLVAMASRYHSMQSRYREVARRVQTNGELCRTLSSLGLSNAGIVLAVVAEVAVMVGVAALLLCISALHADDPSQALSNPVPAVVLPIVSVVRSVRDLEHKRQEVDSSTRALAAGAKPDP